MPAALLGRRLWLRNISGGLAPCEMCWWQRYAHFAALPFALVAAARRAGCRTAAAPSSGWRRSASSPAARSASTMPASSSTISRASPSAPPRWRRLADDLLNQIMAAPVVRCDQVQWSLLGISMAGWNAILSLVWRVDDPMAEPQATAGPLSAGTAWRPGDRARRHRPRCCASTRPANMARPASMPASSPCSASAIPRRGAIAPAWPRRKRRHLAHFDAMLAARGVRPTVLQPFWAVAGHALGAATALIGPEAAMACTAAIEDEIDAHYSEQLEALGDSDPELSAEHRALPGRRARASRRRARGRRGECFGLSLILCRDPGGLPCRDRIVEEDLIHARSLFSLSPPSPAPARARAAARRARPGRGRGGRAATTSASTSSSSMATIPARRARDPK